MIKKRKKSAEKLKDFQDFKVILDLPERLAEFLRLLLHLDKGAWDFALDKIRQGKPYKCWSKSKGRGKGRRHFAAPCPELKLVQKAILNRFLLSIPVHFARHGNQRSSSILTNAAHHAGFAKTVYSIDIINAFPTVFRSRIRANLKKPFGFCLKQFGGIIFDDDEIEVMLESLVDLVCLHDRLPQGAPTSPRLLDIVCCKLDIDIYQLLQTNSTPFQSYRYTAWVDDLTISSDGEIPEELRAEILNLVQKNGFIPHTREDKTKYFAPETGEVPVITGLVLNGDGRLTMAPRKVNQLRSRLGYIAKHEINAELAGQANGLIGYIEQVYPKKLPSKLRELVIKVKQKLVDYQLKQQQGKDTELKIDALLEHCKPPKAKKEKPRQTKTQAKAKPAAKQPKATGSKPKSPKGKKGKLKELVLS